MKASTILKPLIFLGLLAAYAVAVAQTAHGSDERVRSLGLVFWIPIWVAQWSIYSGAGGLRPADLADPSSRMALAGIGLALGFAGLVASMTATAPAAETPFLLFVGGFLLLLCPVAVPGMVNRIRVWNHEQAGRLVAAEHDLATARTRALQSQMQPHFLFNALNSVTALMRENPSRAKTVLLSLKGLMERSLTTSQQTTSTIRDEVAFVRDQLAIEQERFHDRLTVRFDVDSSLLDIPIPPFSLQPLVENALRHGIARSIEGGNVVVRVAQAEQELVLAVENTGAGLEPRWHEGLGLGNLRQRLQSEYGPCATVTVEQHGHRTIATIRMPLHVR